MHMSASLLQETSIAASGIGSQGGRGQKGRCVLQYSYKQVYTAEPWHGGGGSWEVTAHYCDLKGMCV